MVRNRARGLGKQATLAVCLTVSLAVSLAVSVVGSVLTPAGASAQSVSDAKTMMASGDREQVEAGIQTLGLIGSKEAVAPLVDRVRNGLPPDLLETAIITLMALGRKEAAPLLFDLLSHRRPEARAQAAEALAVIQPAGAEDALLHALSDGDPKVRDAAAEALGEVGTAGAVSRLFHALDRGNLRASAAIGKLMAPSEVPRILSYLGKIPLRSLQPAMTQVLTRKDIPTKAKLKFVGQVQELGTAEVRDFLQDVLASEGDGLNPRVTRAIMAAMKGIGR